MNETHGNTKYFLGPIGYYGQGSTESKLGKL